MDPKSIQNGAIGALGATKGRLCHPLGSILRVPKMGRFLDGSMGDQRTQKPRSKGGGWNKKQLGWGCWGGLGGGGNTKFIEVSGLPHSYTP